MVGPGATIVPDLRNKLPGRGAWVKAERGAVETAVSKRAFSRSFKKQVTTDDSLPDLVDKLLVEQVLGALGLARKAGECVTGAGQVATALAKGKAIAVLHASDGANDGEKRAAQQVRVARRTFGEPVALARMLDSMQLSLALGGTHVIHAALIRGRAAGNCLSHIQRLANYRQLPHMYGSDADAFDIEYDDDDEDFEIAGDEPANTTGSVM